VPRFLRIANKLERRFQSHNREEDRGQTKPTFFQVLERDSSIEITTASPNSADLAASNAGFTIWRQVCQLAQPYFTLHLHGSLQVDLWERSPPVRILEGQQEILLAILVKLGRLAKMGCRSPAALGLRSRWSTSQVPALNGRQLAFDNQVIA
jgi:hypothetical protein